jgi:hypothetical protein
MVSLQTKGVDTKHDEKGKEYIVYTTMAHAAPTPLLESSATDCALTAPRSGHLDRLGRPNGV